MNDPRDPVQLDQPPPPAAPAPEVVEDAGTRALAEALRSSFVIVKVIMVLLVVLVLGSGLTTVGTQEKAVILRFGKPVGEGEDALLGPGFHWAWPPPIDEVVKIPIGQVQTVQSSIGWYATTAAREATGAEPPPGTSLNPATDATCSPPTATSSMREARCVTASASRGFVTSLTSSTPRISCKTHSTAR